MNKKLFVVYCFCLFYVFLPFSLLRGEGSAEKPPEKDSELAKEVRRFSRREGYKFAEDIKRTIEWIDLSSVLQGVQDYISGEKISDAIEKEDESGFYQISFKLFELEAEENLRKACACLQDISSNDRLHPLEGGKIFYEVIQEGKGDLVVHEGDSPQLHYTIATLNGLEIVNTRKSQAAYKVSLAETIPGFAKGVHGMRLGERRMMYIHPDLGYGKVGHVPPNSLLIVDVEVVGF